jgi:hypothetical protein
MSADADVGFIYNWAGLRRGFFPGHVVLPVGPNAMRT